MPWMVLDFEVSAAEVPDLETSSDKVTDVCINDDVEVADGWVIVAA